MKKEVSSTNSKALNEIILQYNPHTLPQWPFHKYRASCERLPGKNTIHNTNCCLLCRNVWANLRHDCDQCNLLYVWALSSHVWSSYYHDPFTISLETQNSGQKHCPAHGALIWDTRVCMCLELHSASLLRTEGFLHFWNSSHPLFKMLWSLRQIDLPKTSPGWWERNFTITFHHSWIKWTEHERILPFSIKEAWKDTKNFHAIFFEQKKKLINFQHSYCCPNTVHLQNKTVFHRYKRIANTKLKLFNESKSFLVAWIKTRTSDN